MRKRQHIAKLKEDKAHLERFPDDTDHVVPCALNLIEAILHILENDID